jgi:hypothetical protein
MPAAASERRRGPPWRPVERSELLTVDQSAQRASNHASHNASRALPLVLLAAVLLAVGGLAAQPGTARAAAMKVVIIVGPTGSQTSSYITSAKYYASIARSYGATVYQLYSPYATWSRVLQYSAGANMLIYLGHGNGWPSPYAPFQENTKDGLGLNASYGSNTLKYYGANYIRSYMKLAPDAVVILNRLCYASGNNEWGVLPDPTTSTARQRIDNYGSGFLRAGAKAVFAEGITNASYIIQKLFTTNLSYSSIFWSSPYRTFTYRTNFLSSRTPGTLALLDPQKPGKWYRSVIGWLSTTATAWRTP